MKTYRRQRKDSVAFAGWLNGQPNVAYVEQPKTRIVLAGPEICETRDAAIAAAQDMQDSLSRRGRQPATARDLAHAAMGDVSGLLASSDYPC